MSTEQLVQRVNFSISVLRFAGRDERAHVLLLEPGPLCVLVYPRVVPPHVHLQLGLLRETGARAHRATKLLHPEVDRSEVPVPVSSGGETLAAAGTYPVDRLGGVFAQGYFN